MVQQEYTNVVTLHPASARLCAAPLGDMRFRALLGAKAWAELPPAVQARFSKRLSGAASVVYQGEVVECRVSRLGWWLAHALRIIGAPLPLACDTLVPATVTVTEDEASGGQYWTRQYGHHRSFPQVIQSGKRFGGPTGLEEYVGGGIGVALTLAVRDGALLFVSDHYFLKFGAWRVRLPQWLSPGRLTVGHTDCGDGWFAFTLSLDHAWFGNLMAQTALFSDAH
ncbi:MAG: DUF4166 domain-containing protein [Sphingomonadaceae bacterium]